MQYLLMCRSLTLAQRGVHLLQGDGIFAAVAKAPQSAGPQGCTYGIKVAQRNLERAAARLAEAGVPVLKIFELTENGLVEVQL